MVVPVAVGLPMSVAKPSTEERKAKVLMLEETCPVYTKVVRSISYPLLGVRVQVKYLSVLNVVPQLFAAYRLLAFAPLIPVPRPMPETVMFACTFCPVMYGLAVFGLVPVIGFSHSMTGVGSQLGAAPDAESAPQGAEKATS